MTKTHMFTGVCHFFKSTYTKSKNV